MLCLFILKGFHFKSPSYLDISLSVDVSQNLLQTPEAAGEHAEEGLGYLSRLPLELPLQVGQDDPDHLDDGDDQSTKGQGA